MARILFVHSRRASFIEIDRALLAERHEVRDLYQPGRWANPAAVLSAVRASDVVVGWWASWHTFWPVTLAPVLRTPTLLIVGGFDVANLPEIGYGYQQGGARKWLSRWVIRRAGRLATNSYYSRAEIEENLGISPARVTVTHHGIPDPFGEEPAAAREPLALTVGNVDRPNLERKGLRLFVEAARHAPQVRWVVAGRWVDDGIDELRAAAPDNVEFTGWIEQERLLDLYRRAAAYVQVSRHEGFGVSVAEAMLGGCLPVVTRVGALPEVVGASGIELDPQPRPEEVAAAVARTVDADVAERRAAREHVLTTFSLEGRRRALWELVDGLLEGG